MDTQVFEGTRNIVTGAGKEADVQVLRSLDVNADGFIGGRMIAGIGAQTGVANHTETFFVVFASVVGDGANFVIAGF